MHDTDIAILSVCLSVHHIQVFCQNGLLKTHLFLLSYIVSLNMSSVFSVRRPCSDFTDMLWRLTNRRIIIIYY